MKGHRIMLDEQIDDALSYLDYMAERIQKDAEEVLRSNAGNPEPDRRHLSFRYARTAMEMRALIKLIGQRYTI